jgi:hypothetical protein
MILKQKKRNHDQIYIQSDHDQIYDQEDRYQDASAEG